MINIKLTGGQAETLYRVVKDDLERMKAAQQVVLMAAPTSVGEAQILSLAIKNVAEILTEIDNALGRGVVMAKNNNYVAGERLNTQHDCYLALLDALDLVKAVQAAGLRGVLAQLAQVGDAAGAPYAGPALAARLVEARNALNSACRTMEGV